MNYESAILYGTQGQVVIDKAKANMGQIFSKLAGAVIHDVWDEDLFALGAYSFNTAGHDADSRLALAETVKNRLYFAGEATAEDYPATVHGAHCI